MFKHIKGYILKKTDLIFVLQTEKRVLLAISCIVVICNMILLRIWWTSNVTILDKRLVSLKSVVGVTTLFLSSSSSKVKVLFIFQRQTILFQNSQGQIIYFSNKWGKIHIQSSPGHHNANGKAEAAVEIAKYLLKNATRDGTDQNIALLELRNTPREDIGLSPAQMLFGCETRSVLPCFKRQHKSVVLEKRQNHKEVTKCHDKGAKDLPK